MDVALLVEDLRKTYRANLGRAGKEALRGVSLSIPAGETFGFIGPNGAGKSTLIKILIGALRPSAGKVRLFGGDPAEPAYRQGLGFVPESPSMPEHLTPYEILLMGLRLHRVEIEGPESAHCNYWLDRFDLLRVAGTPIRSFSKGMVQRTALAHALAIKPRMLILDEPLSGLDPIGRRDVVDILAEYRKEGKTLFFSSHVLHDVERIADRFALIDQGRLVMIRSPMELVEDQADRYVIRYRGAQPVEGSSEVRQGMHVLEVGEDKLADVVRAVQVAHGVIQDVLPKNSLEAVFFKSIVQKSRERNQRAGD